MYNNGVTSPFMIFSFRPYISEVHFYEWECTSGMYPSFAKEAEEEGFTQVAALFRMVANIEKEHEERFLKMLANINDGKVFKREEKVVWICRNCGHVYIGEKAPEVCPVCAHPQKFFEIKANNY